ncbi:LacI family DNA-binding transcriptional regulator [Microbacterium sp.]|uniref:LacI family DNA-binding transcriptional regulator n=1 Tax=Microbacterium sp. TaxID=51671 RepID=UPI0039E3D110
MPAQGAPSDPARRGRVTIADVARRAGVTTGAVSLAMNGKPGVSDATRERILRIADELNWRPNHAAKTLRGKRPQSIGLVLARPEEVVGEEAFFAKFLTGVQSVLSQQGYSLHLQMASDLAAESEIHTEWISDGRVDGILVLDPRVDDPRVTHLERLGYPTIVVGGDADSAALSSVRADDGKLLRTIVDHLVGLGHERIGYITGEQTFTHIRRRIDAFADDTIERGVWGTVLAGDFVPQQAKAATRKLLSSPRRPTALVYDSEVMAIAGMATIAELGLRVPTDVSVVSWEDSATCQVLHPTITALNRDAVTLGKLAATEMLQLLAHEPIEHPAVDAVVIQRESTAPPPA